ncbi:MAG: hypothetical protein P8I99_03220 [Acidimicrobiales bacterium]|nr:hypothetical protein [Acidimicrobiales bacterium]MDG1876408.1 hypothetical protein [Acidimicrobiales bacterium]
MGERPPIMLITIGVDVAHQVVRHMCQVGSFRGILRREGPLPDR